MTNVRPSICYARQLPAIAGLLVFALVATIAIGAEQKPTNRLQYEQSPYLQMHAANPVDWFPWGQEAFEAAKRENKPIFLSIGYATCHWCHVMARESFADEEVAALLNASFISIKVDREERPDIDSIYMRAAQVMTGRGGWPLTVVITPDGKPFFAGTYLPKTTRWGLPGLMELLHQLAEAWQYDRDKVMASSERFTQMLKKTNTPAPGTTLDRQIFAQANEALSQFYDPVHGGFGNAPKFPSTHILFFLLRYYYQSGDADSLAMVEKTLAQMRLGGIYDHIGFGFHRYATDVGWKYPHFEKMLYDQALLAMVYAEAYQLTGDRGYARTVREVLTYLMRDARSEEGGFFSAEDAESESREGKFYLWTTDEISAALGEAEAMLVKRLYQVSVGGNYQSPDQAAPGANLLHLIKPLDQIALELGVPLIKLQDHLETIRQKLLAARNQRIRPLKDDKILTDWNGLAIAALAKASSALDNRGYGEAAEAAADFILARLRTENGRLLKRYRNGKAGLTAHLDDYAFVVWGLIELYQAGYKPKYLKAAVELTDLMLTHFWDASSAGFFFTADDSEKLLIRQKEIYDGAIPSGNAVAALNLIRLGQITGRHDYLEKAEAINAEFSSQLAAYPAGYTQMLIAVDLALNASYEVVIVGNRRAADTQAMLATLHKTYLPNKVVVLRPTNDNSASEIIRLAPYTRTMKAINGRATAYVCKQFVCRLPTTSVAQMMASLTNPRNVSEPSPGVKGLKARPSPGTR